MSASQQTGIKHTFVDELPADPNTTLVARQVLQACYSRVNPTPPGNPSWVHLNRALAESIGLNAEQNSTWLERLSGKESIPGSVPYAMCYGGHQFGSWAGQLGDGRAINIAEIESPQGTQTLQLKGAGKTPYSRGADGLAVLRSSVREYLCSEAMHHLGVPTTRALSLVLTGDRVLRDMLYDGHPALEPGAIVCRVAPSFIRFGNFQIFANRGDATTLKKLTDFTLRHFFPGHDVLSFFDEVCARTMKLMLEWERVGFVHGVMNTDNMSILGLTIDYGPYGWLDDYDPTWTPNTTDAEYGRYRFGNQGMIGLWNCMQLANALFPLIENKEALEAILLKHHDAYPQKLTQLYANKLGVDPAHRTFIDETKSMLQKSQMDFTLFFRHLSDFDPNTFLEHLSNSAYTPIDEANWKAWIQTYASLRKASRESMRTINPKVVLRNYMAQLAIDAATQGDTSVLQELFVLLARPYDEQPESERWCVKRPVWALTKVGCSMLSCSS